MTIDLHSRFMDSAAWVTTPSVIAVVTFTHWEVLFKIALLIATLIFTVQGIVMRHRQMKREARESEREEKVDE